MSAVILDGKKRAEEIKRSLKDEVKVLKAAHKQSPKLVALEITEDSAFSVYAKAQAKSAEDIGIEYECQKLGSCSTQSAAIEKIKILNSNDTVTGVMLQAPMPDKFNFMDVISSVTPLKDVEGLHPENKGNLLSGNYKIIPPTASSVMELIQQSEVNLYGKEAVVIGHSGIVGKPIALLLLDKFATVTVCHIATWERGALESHVRRAEVLVVAVGKAGLIKGEWIKKGTVVIDAGINRVKGEITGDIEFQEAKKRASFITPVPGGVGPLTTVMLMQNCVKLFKLQRGIL